MWEPTNWRDGYFKSDVRTVLAEEQLQIPGLRILAKHTLRNAIPPLNWHYHENAFEITMCTKGALSFSSTASNYKISGGDVFITTPNEIHSTDEVPLSLGEHLTLELSLDELAAQCLLSTSQYKQKFKKQVGISPRNFVNQQKIELAKPCWWKGNQSQKPPWVLGLTPAAILLLSLNAIHFIHPRSF